MRKIHGLNIAVRDLEEAVKKYEAVLGVASTSMGAEDFAVPGLRGAALSIGDFVINLIASENEKTSIAQFLEKRGEGLFLVSIAVDQIDEQVGEMEKAGAQFVFKEAAEGTFGKVNFIHPRSMHGVQFEVIELPDKQ